MFAIHRPWHNMGMMGRWGRMMMMGRWWTVDLHWHNLKAPADAGTGRQTTAAHAAALREMGLKNKNYIN
jgi:hypothetical protein